MNKKIINHLFNYTSQEGASDLIITNQPKRISVDCLFPDGAKRSLCLPKELGQEFLANLRQILAIVPGELGTRKYYKIADKDCRLTFYLTILPENMGEKIIINIINQPNKLWRLSQLGLKIADLRALKTALKLRHGLIIISSPPGNGKSATLYSLLAALNDPNLNIYLLSKNPEQEIPGVNPLSPTAANWEKILQQDSEVIALDDLNEDWALKNALRSAATGRLVLMTLPAASRQEILERIKRVELPLKLKQDSLKMIINQHLVDLKRKKIKMDRGERRLIGSFEISRL